ncbi:hypothetical protein BJ978_000983 [Agromyces terreus]|uniref:Uncharacterized protein n=1 Tax=Agromyces terreus TaxID=424795 RepID=A0A9X2H3U4_9MICO|nr:hypothetical protein [Agromyces terreus]MCP2370307.1 hypothetical protein [Agromyces terreus]
MSDDTSTEVEYIVEHVDGPLAGTTDRRVLIGGEVEQRISSVAAVRGVESIFWYVAGDERQVGDERYVKYHFDPSESDPVQSDPDEESL